MKDLKLIVILVGIMSLVLSQASWAEDEDAIKLEKVVVTATRTETPLSEVAKSISVIDRDDMERAQDYFMPELIDNVPGVFLSRHGGPGQFSNISIRGAGTQHTQFQYNGMPLRDAADTQSTLQYFIEDMYAGSNLDRIEVLRGANSTLYGSQAMGGVINIIPEKWKKGFKFEWRNEVGEHSTFKENGRIAYGRDNYYIDLNSSYITTDGEKNGGKYDYYYDNLGFTTGAGVKLGQGITLEFSGTFYDADLASSGVRPSLDTNNKLVKNQADKDKHRESKLYQLGLILNHKISSLWDYAIKGSYGETERHYFWSDISGDQSNYDGDTTYLEMQHNVYPTDWLTLTMGLDYDKSVYNGREPLNPYAGDYTTVNYDYDWGVWDAFGQLQFTLLDESFFFNIGGRYNNHEEFDSKAVWETSAAYIFKEFDTKIHAHVGTGYRTPSLYEIYGGYLYNGTLITIGNPELKPEESISYEVGVDQYLMEKKMRLGLTFFQIDFDDRVIYDGFANKYNNATEAKTDGFEAYLDLKPCDYFKLGIAYTHADSEYKDYITGEWTQKEYLPKNKVNVTVSVYPIEKLTAICRVTWQDEKIVPLYDPSWNKVRWEEDNVVTVDLAASYKIFKFLDVWVRAENLFDEDYSESGYTMPGRWLYAGTKVTF